MTTADADTAIIARPKPKPEPNWRAQRLASPNFVRCPNNCPVDIGCARCHFWGSIAKDSTDAKCAHRWIHVGRIGNALNTHQCATCGEIKAVDSSD